MSFTKQSSNLGGNKGANESGTLLTSNNTAAGTISNATAMTGGGPYLLNSLSNASYTLPATINGDIGATIKVINMDGTNACKIFPAGVGSFTDVGGNAIAQANTINGATANGGVTFAAKVTGDFTCVGSGAWRAGTLTIA